MKHNSLFASARITLSDGTKLKEKNVHILRSILHQQLHTMNNKFDPKKHIARVQVVDRRPVNFREEMENLGVVVN